VHIAHVVRTLAITSFILLQLTGCGPRDVVIAVSVPDEEGVETPLPGVRLVLLPFDRDSLRTVLENRAPSSRPSSARLDSLLGQFRDPFTSYLRIAYAIDRVRSAAAAAPDSASRRRLEDSLQTLTSALGQSRTALNQVRTRLEPAIDSERTRSRGWEDTAFRAYDSLGNAISEQLHREPIVDSTRGTGHTRVRVRAGNWWVVARAVNVRDPNSEWYWNVKLEGDTVRLSSSNGRSRPRI
jgi:hypothetical protein